MIKFKKAGNDHRIRISCDKNGIEQSKTASFKKGQTFWQESVDWLKIPGNELLSEYTADELAENEAKETEQAVAAQKSELQRLLDKSDKKILSDFPYSVEDQDKWAAAREKWRFQILSNDIIEIYASPF